MYTTPVLLALFRTSPMNTPRMTAINKHNTVVQLLNWTKNLKFTSETMPPTLASQRVSVKA